MDLKQPAVYMLASKRNGTLYTGVTSSLVQLVWYELHATMESAITREKRVKKWNRMWKLRLIEELNPEWRDLWEEILGSAGSPPARG